MQRWVLGLQTMFLLGMSVKITINYISLLNSTISIYRLQKSFARQNPIQLTSIMYFKVKDILATLKKQTNDDVI